MLDYTQPGYMLLTINCQSRQRTPENKTMERVTMKIDGMTSEGRITQAIEDQGYAVAATTR